MRLYLLPLILLIYTQSFAQCKTYRIGAKGDTLNCVDQQGIKQGKWAVHTNALRGEPGYEEEGVYSNDKKEGVWRRFNLMGDIMAVENYRWGNKNGKCIYFTLMGIEREESWRALNPTKAYDTIDVADVKIPDKYEKVIVKVETSSLKHGIWKYYNPAYGNIIRIEKYVLDNLQTDAVDDFKKAVDPIQTDSLSTKAVKEVVKPKPKEVTEFEKKNKGKKQIKVRDGRTG